jgi:hypothetical protein
MAKFLLIYRHRVASDTNIAPEEMPKVYQRWQTWIGEGLQKGWLLDKGNGLATEGLVVNAKKVVTDGPFAEAKEFVGGYAIVQADTLAAAGELAKGCPILLQGGSVEVRPFWGAGAEK